MIKKIKYSASHNCHNVFSELRLDSNKEASLKICAKKIKYVLVFCYQRNEKKTQMKCKIKIHIFKVNVCSFLEEIKTFSKLTTETQF